MKEELMEKEGRKEEEEEVEGKNEVGEVFRE